VRPTSQQLKSDPLFPVIGLPRPTIHKDVGRLSNGYDHVVIEGPPRVNELARLAIIASDVVITPMHPSPYDVWAAGEVVRGIGEAMLYMQTPSSCFVFNRKIGVGSQMVKSSAKSVMEQTSGLDFFSRWLRPLRWRSATSAFPPRQDRRGQWPVHPSVCLG